MCTRAFNLFALLLSSDNSMLWLHRGAKRGMGRLSQSISYFLFDIFRAYLPNFPCQLKNSHLTRMQLFSPVPCSFLGRFEYLFPAAESQIRRIKLIPRRIRSSPVQNYSLRVSAGGINTWNIFAMMVGTKTRNSAVRYHAFSWWVFLVHLRLLFK